MYKPLLVNVSVSLIVSEVQLHMTMDLDFELDYLWFIWII